jgi:glycosyltransferase involved in cell wall biosynthesis
VFIGRYALSRSCSSAKMKILQIHNFYKNKGGECAVVHAEKRLLEQHGHTVMRFSKDSADISNYSLAKKTISLLQTPYSFHARRQLSTLIRDHRPDVAHVHNVYPLVTPSIFHALKQHNIPVVQTIHNFRMLCPNGLFFTKGQICESCTTNGFIAAIKNKCMHDSYVISALYGSALWLAWQTGNFPYNIDRYIVLNNFTAKELVNGGVPIDRITIGKNFVDSVANEPFRKERYILYIGRLSREKGIMTLLNALRPEHNLALKIAGTGPLQDEIVKYAANNPLQKIELLGFVSGAKKEDLLQKAICAIVPSECYENAPLSIIESLANGTPVIASRIGGIPDMINDGKIGLLFTPGDVSELSKAISVLANNPAIASKMATTALSYAKANYAPEQHYQHLLKTYREASRV